MSNILSAEEMTISDYLRLSDSKPGLNIPFSQRPYVWNKKEITRFWEDIVTVYKKNEEQHILNFFTLYGDESNSKSFIYDGQQRSVTSVVFLCAIANIYNELYEKTKYEDFISGYKQIKEEYIIKTIRFGSNKGKKNITIKFDDEELNGFFEEYIIKGKVYSDCNENKLETTKNLIFAYKFFKEKIYDMIKDIKENESKAEILDEIVDCLLARFIIVVLTTKNKVIAQRMFNSLNTAGKELDVFYIIKNECVAILGEDKVREKWNEIELNLSDLSKDKFIMYYANVFFGKITDYDEIVDKFKQNNISRDDYTYKFINELLLCSKWYAFCKDISIDEIFEGIDVGDDIVQDIKNSIRILNRQQITSYIPVIFSMILNKYDLEDVRDVIADIEKLMIRNKTIMSQPAQSFNNFYTDLSHEINKDGLHKDSILDKIDSKKVSDKEINDILQISFNRKSLILRMLLAELINMECTDIKIRQDIDFVNLEHIVPKTISKQWKDESGEDIEEYIYHIGNLTLISTPRNSSMKNKCFIEKKEEYKKSNIPMTREIGYSDINVWNKNEILKRSRHISDLICRRWEKRK